MSGRGHGRGNINMTQAELTDLINTRVAEALAAYQAGTECTKVLFPLIPRTRLFPPIMCFLSSFRSASATSTQPACVYVQNVYGL